VAERLRAKRLHRGGAHVAELERDDPVRGHQVEVGGCRAGARPVPHVDEERPTGASGVPHDPPRRRQVAHPAVGHGLQRDDQVVPRPVAEPGECRRHGLGGQVLEQARVEVPDAERAGHVEHGALLLLLGQVAVLRGAPAGEVLDLEDPHLVLGGDREHVRVVQSSGPGVAVVLRAQPDPVEARGRGGAHPLAERHPRAERVGADHQRR
jgi:hypothetical protein